MPDQEHNIFLGEIVFDDENEERKIVVLFRTNVLQIFNCVFLPTFFLLSCFSLVAFEEFIIRKLVMNQMFGWDLCIVQLDTFYHQENYEQVNFYKNRTFISLFGPIRDGKVTNFLHVAQNCYVSNKIDQKLLFYQISQPLYVVTQGEIEGLEFVHCVNFEFSRYAKNNGTKNLLFFDHSCKYNFNSKAFVAIATAGRHCVLSTTYNDHILFHQSKLVRQWATEHASCSLHITPWHDASEHVSAQFGLRLELVDRYGDATSEPYGHLLIGLSSRTDNRIRFCINRGSISSKFGWNNQIFRTIKSQILCFLIVPINFRLMGKPFPSVLSKKVYRFLCECIKCLLKGNFRSVKRHHVTEYQNKDRLFSLKYSPWSKEGMFWHLKKAFNSWKSILFPSITICLDKEQCVFVPASVYNNKCLNTQTVT